MTPHQLPCMAAFAVTASPREPVAAFARCSLSFS